MGNADRTEPVTLIGPKGLERVVNALRVIAPELPFEIKFIELTSPEETIEIHGYKINAFQVKHNVICYGYSINIRRGGRFYTERALENNVPQKHWNRLQKGDTIIDGEITYTPDMVIGPERKGIKLTYCTDSRPVKSIADHAEGSDLFICEGMYGENEKDNKAKEYKHMTFCEAAKLAQTAQVREMWLTHYSPSLIRPEDFIGEARRIFPNTKPGKDRKSVTLEFEQEE
jgi:ribonuclease Z